MYQVIDGQTNLPVGKPVATRNAARRKIDRLDNAYGGYRYNFIEVAVKQEARS